jgi:hypothetical protein
MLKRTLSLALAAALVCSLGGASVLAQAAFDSRDQSNLPGTLSASNPTAANDAMSNGKLRAGLLKLVADVKAGKITPAGRPQIQPAQSNNLSKGAKIAVGVGIAVAVVVVVLVIRKPRLTGPVL